MKNTILLFLFLVIGISCNSKTKESKDVNEENPYAGTGEYTIYGVSMMEGVNDKYIYLIRDVFTSGGEPQMDSALIQNGKFTFSGIQKTPVVYTLVFGFGENNRQIWGNLVLEGGKIYATIDNGKIYVGGTPGNEAFQSSRDSIVGLYDKYMEKIHSLTGTQEEKDEKSDALYKNYLDQMCIVNVDYIKTHSNDPLAQKVMFDSYRLWPVDKIEEVLNQFQDSVKKKSPIKHVIENYGYMKNVEIGKKYVDMKSVDLKGKEIALSDYIGKAKYVIIDFWSPGCNTCIAELATFTEAYKLYKDKGLEIIGVSLDCDKERWAAASKEHKITWPQMLSGLCNNGQDAGKPYAVTSMPLAYIVDKDGTIISKGLKGKALIKKLDELLK